MNEINPKELSKLLKENADAVQLLDVREDNERAIFNIGGTHIPLSSFNIETANTLLQKDKPLVVYCRSGGRSANACHQLEQAGFNQVMNLKGGMISWQEMLICCDNH